MKCGIFLLSTIMLLGTVITAKGVGAMPEKDNASKLEYWVEDALVKVLPNVKPPIVATKEVVINAARDEFESAQIIVKANTDIENLSVKPSRFNGNGNSTVCPRISVDFVSTVPVKIGTKDTPREDLLTTSPADIPDPISEARFVSVSSGVNQTIWITVHVTPRTLPGTYTCSVRISADGHNVYVPVTLNVYAARVSPTRSLFVTNWFSTDNIAKAHNVEKWSEPFWKKLMSWAKVMADHRQNTVITPIFELITAKKDSDGNMTFDFSKFDRWVKLFFDAKFTTIEGGHFGGRSEWEAPDFNATHMTTTLPDGSLEPDPGVKVSSEAERVFLSKFLPAYQAHLEKKGWLKHYYQHLCDEPITVNAESYNKLSSYVKEYAPKFKIIDASMCKEIVGHIDTWVPQPQEVDGNPAFFKERVKAGDEVWIYTCLAPKGKYMNRFIDYPLLKTRLLHWMNFKYGFTGYLHWGLNYWQGDPFTLLEPDWGGGTTLPPGDSHILYPGKRNPSSSIRFEAMRDGIEDYELLKQLAQKNPEKANSICNSIVRSMTDYTLDPKQFRAARLELLNACSK